MPPEQQTESLFCAAQACASTRHLPPIALLTCCTRCVVGRLQHYAVNVLKDEQTMIVTGLELVQQGDGAEPAAEAAASDAAGSKPDQQATPTAAKQPPSTPAAAAGGTRSLLGTPGPAPSPSEE